jgi:hypothetical protein
MKIAQAWHRLKAVLKERESLDEFFLASPDIREQYAYSLQLIAAEEIRIVIEELIHLSEREIKVSVIRLRGLLPGDWMLRKPKKKYTFIFDERIFTERLLGKPSPGLPPPGMPAFL